MDRSSPSSPKAPMDSAPQTQEKQVAVDGFQQVIEMLKIADPAFRESLLKRLAARDRELALQLRRDLGI
jgi:hypothetical protein